jgi:hypothetical protein
MSPFRSTPPPVRAQIVMIIVMALGLIGIIAFKDRCVGALTQEFNTVSPPASTDAGSRNR